MVFAASNALTENILYEWKPICRHNKVPRSWKSMDDIMSRFMRGFNSEIRTMHIPKTYSHISNLFCLAKNAENQILYPWILARIICHVMINIFPLYMLKKTKK
jgi:hypothetical protein